MSGCALCAKPAGRGKHLCRAHWMMLDHWHHVQIGNAMKAERASGLGPSSDDRVYGSEEFLLKLQAAVESLHVKAQKLATEKEEKHQVELAELRELWKEPRICAFYEGCRGTGWIYDLEDLGSGRTVYCACAAGQKLQATELKEGT